MTPAQRLDDDTTIIEHTKARRSVASRVMEPANRHERATPRPGHDPLGRLETTPYDPRRRLVNTAKIGSVAAIEHPAAMLGAALHEFDVRTTVKQQQFIDSGLRRVQLRDPWAQPALLEFAQERSVTIGPERVPAGKPVVAQSLTQGHGRLRILVNETPRRLPAQPNTSTQTRTLQAAVASSGALQG
jgi:hypothetical protein